MIKGLLENECGGQNPLMKLTAHFTNASADQKLTQDAIKSLRSIDQNGSNNVAADNFVSEYLGVDQRSGRLPAPKTFHMEALLSELKQIDGVGQQQQQQQMQQQQPIAMNAASIQENDWSQEYWSSLNAAFQKQSPHVLLDEKAFKWSAEYLTPNEATIFDEAWESLLLKNSNSFLQSNSSSLLNNENNNLETQTLNEEMRKTANELLDSMQDSRFSETEFLQFVRNLSTNLATESSLNDSDLSSKLTETEQQPTEQISNNSSAGGIDIAAEWVKEFQDTNETDKLKFNDSTSEQNKSNFWEELQDEWNSAAQSNPDHPWLEEFQRVFDTYNSYEFDTENPLKQHPNPFEEGIERLKKHDIVNAVLLFEVAVQLEPANMLAWQYLGTTQVENEQDAQAIRALRRCLELKPDNLTALSTLATSYTNESMQKLAFISLINWIKYHTDYSHLLKNDEQAARLLADIDSAQSQNDSPFYVATLSVVHARDFIDLQEIYLKAVRESASKPNKIDPDLQCCLGVLFHLSGEYDKAADCFKTALQIKPNDHLLWNKLGATYANSNRNEEAIDAYYQALKLCPGFVRARYNLGIGCMNLGAYKEAVEHFLTALVQQSQANLLKDSSPTTNVQQMSDTIWNTLRLALSYLNRNDLYTYCLNKDLEQLKQEFNI